ncbi:MAG TPA: DsbA family protein [Longimicrobium sp.]|nr:DsbA family protein [Longimicrobium sp.]
MNRDLFSNLTTGLLVVCAMVMTGAVVRRELTPPPAAGPDMSVRKVDNWAALTAAGQWLGDRDAPVRVVEFSDFQCPFCAKTHPVLEAVRRRHPGRVAVLYRHYPLDEIHPHARQAAVGSECAASQGRFGEYTNALFAQQDSIGTKPWARFAAEAGVRDSAAFTRCLATAPPRANVERDARLARETGVEVTPTLVINGTLRPGAVTEAELERLIAEAGGR